ncbi:MAG: DegQ family serine endoprotease [Alphaproteobacteria bacterium]|nr:DegQ family serine endoprotease [Alphaproteobacteria bacterium]
MEFPLVSRPRPRLVGCRLRDAQSRSLRMLSFALAALFLLAGAPAFAKPGPDGFSELAEKLLPAVVNISTTQTLKADRQRPEIPQFPPGSPFEEFFKDFLDRNLPRGQHPETQPQPRKATSLGSGFIVDPAGLVVTNNHVIADADEITVILHDDTSLKAEVVGKDTKTDLALLRVKSDKPLPAVAFGDSDKMKIGDWVLAIGNPFGLGGTVTAGIVSARARDIQQGPYDDFIQTDAAINRGNSGGPMFNMSGEVVGINTAIFSPSGGSIGIGFAIPSSLAKPVVAQLKDFGKARRGWLGVRIQGVTDEIAESLGLDKARGALVASVSDKGPAQVAGIQPGDIVLSFDGKDIPDMKHLPRVVAETPIDKTVKVTLWRKRQEQAVQVKVGELDENEEKQASLTPGQPAPHPGPGGTAKALGLTLSAVTPELKQKFSLSDDADGVVVVEVASDSAAAEKGLKPGDIIVEVAQQEVKTPDQISAKVQEAKSSGRKSILLLVDRAGDLRFIALRLDQG